MKYQSHSCGPTLKKKILILSVPMTFIQHNPNHNKHNVQENSDCDMCKKWSLHFEMYTNARIKYEEQSGKTKNGKIKTILM